VCAHAKYDSCFTSICKYPSLHSLKSILGASFFSTNVTSEIYQKKKKKICLNIIPTIFYLTYLHKFHWEAIAPTKAMKKIKMTGKEKSFQVKSANRNCTT
jgi:hypothetical protein